MSILLRPQPLAAVLCFLLSLPVIALSPGAAAAQDATPQAVGQLAVTALLKQVALDPTVTAQKTGKPLPVTGSWSVVKEAPASCPPESRCVTIRYTVPDADVLCQWTVALNSNNDGTLLDQNADASRYMVRVLTQEQARALVLSRKQPTYPGIGVLAHMNGETVLRMSVSTTGNPEKVDIVSTSKPMFGPTAIDAAKQWRFKPLLVGTQAVRFQMILKFVFVTQGPGSARVTSTP